MRRRKATKPAEIVVSLIATAAASLYFASQTGLSSSSVWRTVFIASIAALALFLLVWLIREMWTEHRYRALRLAEIDSMPGLEFERYIGKLLTSRGFDVTVTRSSGDLGVDVIAKSQDQIYAVQVKRSAKAVSRRAVSDAVAGMAHYRCSKSMVITNNYFTPGAKQLAQSTQCELIDRGTLADWIREYTRVDASK